MMLCILLDTTFVKGPHVSLQLSSASKRFAALGLAGLLLAGCSTTAKDSEPKGIASIPTTSAASTSATPTKTTTKTPTPTPTSKAAEKPAEPASKSPAVQEKAPAPVSVDRAPVQKQQVAPAPAPVEKAPAPAPAVEGGIKRGQFCSKSIIGQTATASNGTLVTCTAEGDRARWR